MIDVTHSKKDWDDFWYNSKEELPKQSKHNYNELVDHLVTTMRPPFVPKKVTQSKSNYEAPFDTEAYANYKALVDKEKEQIDTDNLTESIYRLGFKIDTLLTKIIDQLDTILEENYPDNGILEDDKIEEVGYD